MMRAKGWLGGLVILLLAGWTELPAAGSGHFELGFHLSKWSLNLLGKTIENKAGDIMADNLRDKFMDEIRKTLNDPNAYEIPNTYTQDVQFDSRGSNIGAEFRWYPAGHGGSFSLGLAVEQSSMKISFPLIAAKMEVASAYYQGHQAVFEGSVSNSSAQIKPLSFHFSMRWDIVPRWRVHPYFTFGFGLFSVSYLEKGTLYTEWQGTLKYGSSTILIQGKIDKTVRQAIDESEPEDRIDLPSLLPIVQLNLGLKVEFTKNVQLLVDAGIWDGFLLRAGIALRL